MMEVLGRRNEIEEELRNLVITRPPEDSTAQQSEIITSNKPVTTLPPVTKDSVITNPSTPPVVTSKPALIR